MVPTIDISLIGVLLTIWGVIKAIVGSVVHALNFASQKIMAVVAGSKIWATAAFFAVGALIVRLLQTVLDSIFTLLFGLITSVPSMQALSQPLAFFNVVFPVSKLVSVLSFGISCRLALFAVENWSWAFRRAQFLYELWSRAWKT